MKRCEIGECVYVIFHKLWGKYPINGKLRSQHWWQQRRELLKTNVTPSTFVMDWEPGIFYPDGTPIPNPPIYEHETIT